MPVEIKELHIKVAVTAAPGGQAPAASAAGGRGGGAAGGGGGAGDKDAIVAECVEQVLHIIHARKER